MEGNEQFFRRQKSSAYEDIPVSPPPPPRIGSQSRTTGPRTVDISPLNIDTFSLRSILQNVNQSGHKNTEDKSLYYNHTKEELLLKEKELLEEKRIELEMEKKMSNHFGKPRQVPPLPIDSTAASSLPPQKIGTIVSTGSGAKTFQNKEFSRTELSHNLRKDEMIKQDLKQRNASDFREDYSGRTQFDDRSSNTVSSDYFHGITDGLLMTNVPRTKRPESIRLDVDYRGSYDHHDFSSRRGNPESHFQRADLDSSMKGSRRTPENFSSSVYEQNLTVARADETFKDRDDLYPRRDSRFRLEYPSPSRGEGESIRRDSDRKRSPDLHFNPNKSQENSSANEREVKDHLCKLICYDRDLRAGVVSFKLEFQERLAFFQESVFISETVDPLYKQLIVGESLKFHGYLLNPEHKIPYCVSVLWPLRSAVNIRFFRPQDDDLSSYCKKVDRALLSLEKTALASDVKRSPKLASGRRSRSRSQTDRQTSRFSSRSKSPVRSKSKTPPVKRTNVMERLGDKVESPPRNRRRKSYTVSPIRKQSRGDRSSSPSRNCKSKRSPVIKDEQRSRNRSIERKSRKRSKSRSTSNLSRENSKRGKKIDISIDRQSDEKSPDREESRRKRYKGGFDKRPRSISKSPERKKKGRSETKSPSRSKKRRSKSRSPVWTKAKNRRSKTRSPLRSKSKNKRSKTKSPDCSKTKNIRRSREHSPAPESAQRVLEEMSRKIKEAEERLQQKMKQLEDLKNLEVPTLTPRYPDMSTGHLSVKSTRKELSIEQPVQSSVLNEELSFGKPILEATKRMPEPVPTVEAAFGKPIPTPTTESAFAGSISGEYGGEIVFGKDLKDQQHKFPVGKGVTATQNIPSEASMSMVAGMVQESRQQVIENIEKIEFKREEKRRLLAEEIKKKKEMIQQRLLSKVHDRMRGKEKQTGGAEEGNSWKSKVHVISVEKAAEVTSTDSDFGSQTVNINSIEMINRSKKVERHPPKSVLILPVPPPAPPSLTASYGSNNTTEKQVEIPEPPSAPVISGTRGKKKKKKKKGGKSNEQDNDERTIEIFSSEGRKGPNVGREVAIYTDILPNAVPTLKESNLESQDIEIQSLGKFSIVAPVHRQDFNTSAGEYIEIAEFNPFTVPVTNMVLGNSNIMRMAGIVPHLSKAQSLWNNTPLMYISTQGYLSKVKQILIATLLRLKEEFKSDSTHIMMFIGYVDAVFIKIDEIYDLLLEFVEEVIKFNLQKQTNFSISFGEVVYPGHNRSFDRSLFILNQIIRIINYHFLKAESIKMWEYGTAPNKDPPSDQCVNVKGSNLRLLPEHYAPQDFNILNDEQLFKLSCEIRKSFKDRFIYMDQIDTVNVMQPIGIDSSGTRCILPNPNMTEHMGIPCCDVLVDRVKKKLLNPDYSKMSSLAKSLYKIPNRPTIDLARITVQSLYSTMSTQFCGSNFSLNSNAGDGTGNKVEDIPMPPSTSNISTPPPGDLEYSPFIVGPADAVPEKGANQKPYTIEPPRHRKTFTTNASIFTEYGEIDPLAGVQVRFVVIGDENVKRLAEIKIPGENVFETLWISCKVDIVGLTTVMMKTLERLKFCGNTSAKLTFFLHPQKVSTMNLTEAYNHLSALIIRIGAFNLFHGTCFKFSFMGTYFPLLTRNNDEDIYYLNNIMTIINYYFLNVKTYNLSRDTTIKKIPGGLNVKSLARAIKSEVFDQKERHLLTYNFLFDLKKKVISFLQIFENPTVVPQWVNDEGALVNLPAPVLKPQDRMTPYPTILYWKCMKLVEFEKEAKKFPKAFPDTLLKLPQPFLPTNNYTQDIGMEKSKTWSGQRGKVVNENLQDVTDPSAVYTMKKVMHHKEFTNMTLTGQVMHYEEIADFDPSQGIQYVVIGDVNIKRLAQIRLKNKLDIDKLFAKNTLWIAGLRSPDQIVILWESLRRIHELYNCSAAKLVFFPFDNVLNLNPPQEVYYSMLDQVEEVVRFNILYLTKFTILLAEPFLPCNNRNNDISWYNLTKSINVINYHILSKKSFSSWKSAVVQTELDDADITIDGKHFKFVKNAYMEDGTGLSLSCLFNLKNQLKTFLLTKGDLSCSSEEKPFIKQEKGKDSLLSPFNALKHLTNMEVLAERAHERLGLESSLENLGHTVKNSMLRTPRPVFYVSYVLNNMMSLKPDKKKAKKTPQKDLSSKNQTTTKEKLKKFEKKSAETKKVTVIEVTLDDSDEEPEPNAIIQKEKDIEKEKFPDKSTEDQSEVLDGAQPEEASDDCKEVKSKMTAKEKSENIPDECTEDQSEVLEGEKSDYCSGIDWPQVSLDSEVIKEDLPKWTEYINKEFNLSEVKLKHVFLWDDNCVSLSKLRPIDKENLNVWKATPVLYVAYKKEHGEQYDLEALMERLSKKFNLDFSTSGTVTIMLMQQYDFFKSLDVNKTFDLLSLYMKQVLSYNLENKAQFRLSFVECPFPWETRAFDKDIFVYNEIVNTVNYRINETISLKFWWFSTDYNQGEEKINIKNIRLFLSRNHWREDKENRFQLCVLYPFSIYLSWRLHAGMSQRELKEEPSFGIDCKGSFIDLPVPVNDDRQVPEEHRSKSNLVKFFMSQIVNKGLNEEKKPTLDISKLIMFPRYSAEGMKEDELTKQEGIVELLTCNADLMVSDKPQTGGDFEIICLDVDKEPKESIANDKENSSNQIEITGPEQNRDDGIDDASMVMTETPLAVEKEENVGEAIVHITSENHCKVHEIQDDKKDFMIETDTETGNLNQIESLKKSNPKNELKVIEEMETDADKVMETNKGASNASSVMNTSEKTKAIFKESDEKNEGRITRQMKTRQATRKNQKKTNKKSTNLPTETRSQVGVTTRRRSKISEKMEDNHDAKQSILLPVDSKVFDNEGTSGKSGSNDLSNNNSKVLILGDLQTLNFPRISAEEIGVLKKLIPTSFVHVEGTRKELPDQISRVLSEELKTQREITELGLLVGFKDIYSEGDVYALSASLYVILVRILKLLSEEGRKLCVSFLELPFSSTDHTKDSEIMTMNQIIRCINKYILNHVSFDHLWRSSIRILEEKRTEGFVRIEKTSQMFTTTGSGLLSATAAIQAIEDVLSRITDTDHTAEADVNAFDVDGNEHTCPPPLCFSDDHKNQFVAMVNKFDGLSDKLQEEIEDLIAEENTDNQWPIVDVNALSVHIICTEVRGQKTG